MKRVDSSSIVAADVTWVMDERGQHVVKTTHLDGPRELQRLLSFFPGVGTGRQSCRAGGWKTGVEVRFAMASGGVLKVAIDSNCRCWSEGPGDWPLEEGFAEYIRSLFA